MSLRALVLIAVGTMAACGGSFATHTSPWLPAASRQAPAGARSADDGVGDEFTFGGTLVETTDGKMQRADVTQKIVVTATPYPYGKESGSLDYRSTEWDRFRGGTRRWAADAWRGSGPVNHGIAPMLLYGSDVDEDANTYRYRYPVPLVVDRQPERDGATWSNGAGLRYDETDRDGTFATMEYWPAGGYEEGVLYPYDCSFAKRCRLEVKTSSDGSGRYSGSALESHGIDSIVIAAPLRQSIAIVFNETNGSKKRYAVGAWFARGSPLYGESDTIHTHVTFPRTCAAAKRFGRSGNVVVRALARIDPAAGYFETQEIASYTSPRYGSVCLTMSDRRLVYYDVAAGRFSRTPLDATRVTEVLSLRSERLKNAPPAIATNAAASIVIEHFRRRAFDPPIGARGRENRASREPRS